MPQYKVIIPNDFILRYVNATSSPSPNSLFILKALGETQQMSKYCLFCLACKMCICIYIWFLRNAAGQQGQHSLM